jgi:hypothetical protein
MASIFDVRCPSTVDEWGLVASCTPPGGRDCAAVVRIRWAHPTKAHRLHGAACSHWSRNFIPFNSATPASTTPLSFSLSLSHPPPHRPLDSESSTWTRSSPLFTFCDLVSGALSWNRQFRAAIGRLSLCPWLSPCPPSLAPRPFQILTNQQRRPSSLPLHSSTLIIYYRP